MDYKVSALKYRPSEFGKVIGQNHVTDTLKNSVKENKIPSAILFCGPKGVGKTTCVPHKTGFKRRSICET